MKRQCRKVREGLTEYLENALPLVERQGFEEHLATCAECRRLLDELRCTRSAHSALPPTPMHDEMTQRLLEAFRDRNSP